MMNVLVSLSVFIIILLLPDGAQASLINNTEGESIEDTITVKEPIKEEHDHALKLSMKGGWRTKGFVAFLIVFVILAYIFVATVLRWIVHRLERLCGCSNDDDV